jgi:hypothetical protein
VHERREEKNLCGHNCTGLGEIKLPNENSSIPHALTQKAVSYKSKSIDTSTGNLGIGLLFCNQETVSPLKGCKKGKIPQSLIFLWSIKFKRKLLQSIFICGIWRL